MCENANTRLGDLNFLKNQNTESRGDPRDGGMSVSPCLEYLNRYPSSRNCVADRRDNFDSRMSEI